VSRIVLGRLNDRCIATSTVSAATGVAIDAGCHGSRTAAIVVMRLMAGRQMDMFRYDADMTLSAMSSVCRPILTGQTYRQWHSWSDLHC